MLCVWLLCGPLKSPSHRNFQFLHRVCVSYIFYASSWKVCNLGAFHPQPFSIYHCKNERASANTGGEFIFPVQFICSGAAKGERCTREDYGADKVHLFLFVKNPNERTHFLLWVERDDASWGCMRIAGITGCHCCCCDSAFFVAARAETFCYAHW